MCNKKNVRNYIKHYKKLVKSGMHGAAGFAETEPDKHSDLEVAVRYLRTQGMPLSLSTENHEGKRQCYVTIEG